MSGKMIESEKNNKTMKQKKTKNKTLFADDCDVMEWEKKEKDEKMRTSTREAITWKMMKMKTVETCLF